MLYVIVVYVSIIGYLPLLISGIFIVLDYSTGFLHEFFSQGAKSIGMQISFVMLFFKLFSDQISGGSLRGGPASTPHPPWKKASLIRFAEKSERVWKIGSQNEIKVALQLIFADCF